MYRPPPWAVPASSNPPSAAHGPRQAARRSRRRAPAHRDGSATLRQDNRGGAIRGSLPIPEHRLGPVSTTSIRAPAPAHRDRGRGGRPLRLLELSAGFAAASALSAALEAAAPWCSSSTRHPPSPERSRRRRTLCTRSCDTARAHGGRRGRASSVAPRTRPAPLRCGRRGRTRRPCVSDEEAAALLARLVRAVAAVVELCEGWPAGSPVGQPWPFGTAPCPGEFLAGRRVPLAYLVEEVLDLADPATAAFLLESSVLERFTSGPAGRGRPRRLRAG